MNLTNKILGRTLASTKREKRELTPITAVPALGLDAFASIAYGPEAAIAVLIPLGIVGLHYFLPITLAILAVLLTLYLSYQQTSAAYPQGGGAYNVAKANLGEHVAILAAIALLLDYLLNVAVGISAGIGVVVSALPSLHPYTLLLCLFVLFTLTLVNLRGVRESGLIFIIPTLFFVGLLAIVVIYGLLQVWQSGSGYPSPIIAPPVAAKTMQTMSLWLLLGAFANGLTAMTGIEAVSNAVPIFHQPMVKNAQRTLTIIVLILGLFLLALGFLCPAYYLVAMDESKSGYQTILSQLVAAVMGKGIFYNGCMISIFIVLTYSAQTSFADFPRVCRLLAEDGFLPGFFAERGRRLVYSYGIVILAIFSGILLLAFGGITMRLIPLFAIGAFSAFLFSQIGMIMHWIRNRKKKRAYLKLTFNAVGALTTFIALIILVIEKFMEGAWLTVLIVPIMAYTLIKIQRHYQRIHQEIDKPLELRTAHQKSPLVVIPIKGWDFIAEKALRFGFLLSDEIILVHVNEEKEAQDHMKNIWKEKIKIPAKQANLSVPKLVIINSPYRRVYKPIVTFISHLRKENPHRLIAVVIPELVEPHWYEYFLHNIRAAGLRTLLFMKRDYNTIVITIPWYLRE